ncbi:MAG: excisionase family DNA-binding protein [Candidatus Liptonbacteria bacterium]|nr:excisionase family DNA-binding protein [Candidatus Liptonbacteria bacterium]
MEKEFYSTAEAAKLLRVSRVSIFQKIKSGNIRAQKVGRNFIIKKSDLFEALGNVLSKEKKQNVDRAVAKALRDYGEVFKKLGKE